MRPTPFEQVVDAIGNLARPFAIYWTSGAAGVAIVRLAKPGTDLSDASFYIAAVLTGVAAIYGAKAWEEAIKKKQQLRADTEVAKADATVAVAKIEKEAEE